MATATDGATPQEAESRWLPESCTPLLEVARAQGKHEPEGSAEARWNEHYRQGFEASRQRELETAETSFCLALEAAQEFGPRDLRFAETLDELGLVSYLQGDDAKAEALQGAATAEILLTLGPPAPDQSEDERSHCRSSLTTYLGRLGWVLERRGKGEQIEELRRAPYLVLARGYLPREALDERLDWLVSRYLLAEDLVAADWLTALRR